jgi:glycine/D-amino acid oxidase-like deaminating enzyme
MARRADVVVVGAGIMGACAALALARRGLVVELIEQYHPAAGSSGKSGAILRQHYTERALVRLARAGLQFYGSFESRFGEAIGFRRHGMILIAPAGARAALQTAVAMQREEGVPVEMVDDAQLAQIEARGWYEADLVACYEADSGCVDPRRSVEAIVDLAAKFRARLSFGERLLAIDASGGAVRGVRTTLGTIATERLVLAAGPWSRPILSAVGIELPLRVIRPEQAFLEPPARFGREGPIFIDLRGGHYWKPEGDRHTRVGGIDLSHCDEVDDPDDYDESASDAFCRAARAAVAHRLPGYARATIWGGCGALYTMSPDQRPLLGTSAALAGIYLMAGFSGHGFKLGPPLGEGIAEWVCDGAPRQFAATDFAVDRFAAGALDGGAFGLY